MSFNDALAYLLSLGHETLTIKLGLENTRTLLKALGNPHQAFRAVQIAGTNGKGSTAVMLDSICRQAGIRTGLFTSPHLSSITERIKTAGRKISESEFARCTDTVKAVAENLVREGQLQTLPTFFEHITAIALLAFREAKIDLAILETGLGGRLDSTTAANADLVAITAIAMDHEEYLGQSLAEIAGEKAAIIRPGVTAVIASQLPDALKVIINQCAATGAETVFAGGQVDEGELPAQFSHRVSARFEEVTTDGRCVVTIDMPNERYEKVSLGLRGRHQIDNAAVAVGMAAALRDRAFTISSEAIVTGLQNASHAGRLELWKRAPAILFDGAHNPAAAWALRNFLDEFVRQPITMIFGAMRDKQLEQMAAILFPKAAQLILTEIDNPRAASIETLRAATPTNLDPANIQAAESVAEAIEIAEKISAPDGLICITGSLYLIGATQQILHA